MEDDPYIVFGLNPVLEKLKASPTDVREILIGKGSERPNLRSVEAIARQLGLRVTYVESGLLDRLANRQRHQGVVAKVRGFSYSNFSDLLQHLSDSPNSQWILLLDGLTDPRNFGAVLRTAEAVGIQHVLIPKDRSVGLSPIVVKASAGAVHYLKIYKVTNLRRAIAALKERGLWIVGLHARAEENLYCRDFPDRLGIVLGSEGSGIRPLIQRECDFLVGIPMLGKIGSLNVAVAGAVFLYELLRRQVRIDNGEGKR
ncbi:MAG: 23S rRNA (guanosine(2251)-2'-O)-methyltransferase RlmB [Deltaproteobacteria bacterium]|nr:23S rRNA (guanosine(2251)-2'-O)-methyltransferase RlmB [Deltaproteobacteria bacterium]